jgi:dipeptidyl aminopeptidase/acylaminoacyl peptidase
MKIKENIMRKRKINADDLLKMKFLRSIKISPDESKIAFTVQVASKDKKKYYSHLYLVNIDGTELTQFTKGKISDSNPVFSPDGKCIYFTSKRGETKGIFRIRTSGGEAEHWLGEDGSYSSLSFSPDGKKLLCVFQKADDLPKNKDGKKEEPVYRHITKMFYKLDDTGFLPKDPGHVYVIDIKTRKAKRITNGKNGERSPVWIGNSSIAYVSNIHKYADEEYLRDDIFVISAKGGKTRKLNKPAGEVHAISVSPDNKEIAFIGHDNPNDAWGVAPVHLWKLPVRGGKAVDLTPRMKRNAYDSTISDTAEGFGVLPPAWSADGKHIYFQVSENGSTRLYRVGSSGRGLSKVIAGKIHVTGYSLDGKTLLPLYQATQRPPKYSYLTRVPTLSLAEYPS